MRVIAVLKKETDEPLKEALHYWGNRPPSTVVENKKKRERTEIWDCKGVQTLSTSEGPIRVLRALIHREGETKPKRWCIAVTGGAMKLGPGQLIAAIRGRWHLENTAFCQWTLHWHFEHVFRHDPNAIAVLFWLFALAFNLLQLFVYRQLRGYGRDRGADATRTFRRIIDQMIDDLARVIDHFVWNSS